MCEIQFYYNGLNIESSVKSIPNVLGYFRENRENRKIKKLKKNKKKIKIKIKIKIKMKKTI
jgi:hypothetical protein